MSETSRRSARPATPVRRALISVADKGGLNEFAGALAGRGVELIATGETYRQLRADNIEVTEISEYTRFPEMMAGRVKTLHPKIHGGILARQGADEQVMAEHDIAPIDLVAVNLYPFERVAGEPEGTLEQAIENIDIGGPTLLRAAAKNHARVTVLTDSDDYPALLEALENHGGTVPPGMRRRLAVKAFEYSARYEDAIANYLGRLAGEGDTSDPRAFPSTFNCQLVKHRDLRYGENPHQRAAFYAGASPPEAGTLAGATQLQGKALSYNNIADADAALEMVGAFSQVPACAIVKHANPCGIAVAPTLKAAYQSAFATDPVSAYGGILAFSQAVDAETASAVLERQFVEVIVAPSADEGALERLRGKKNIRVLLVGDLARAPTPAYDLKGVSGGVLVQEHDVQRLSRAELKVVSRRQPEAGERRALLFAWQVVNYVKSNAIVYARDSRTIGIGAGQMSRVDSARLAALKARDAGLEVAGSVMASDAFFPFRDGIDTAAEIGIRAVIQPGGSRRDAEVIQAADEAGMAMLFTGERHFRH